MPLLADEDLAVGQELRRHRLDRAAGAPHRAEGRARRPLRACGRSSSIDGEGSSATAHVSRTGSSYQSVDDLERRGRRARPDAGRGGGRSRSGGAPALRGEAAGEGPPIVLCHGITATRRYVVHGSRALERAGHAVVAYDARGHGESDPAPAGEGYGYPELVGDLERVVADQVGRGAVPPRRPLDGRPHRGRLRAAPPRAAGGAGRDRAGLHGRDRARVARLLGRPRRGAGGRRRRRLRRLHRRASRGSTRAWRDSVLRFTRERMLLPAHLEALAQALREVPRSRPFELARGAGGARGPDPGRRQQRRRRPGPSLRGRRGLRARRCRRRELVSEAEGESPLAWQGGKLSRAH